MAFDLTFDAAAGVGTDVNYAGLTVDGAATFDTIDGPLPVLDFDDTDLEAAIFRGVMPESYDTGSSTTIKVYWHADTATGLTGVSWKFYFMRLQDVTTDLESTSEFNTTGAEIEDDNHSSSEFAQSASTTITNANMDSVAAGEEFYMLVVRDPDDANDDMTGDACLHAVKLSQA